MYNPHVHVQVLAHDKSWDSISELLASGFATTGNKSHSVCSKPHWRRASVSHYAYMSRLDTGGEKSEDMGGYAETHSGLPPIMAQVSAVYMLSMHYICCMYLCMLCLCCPCTMWAVYVLPRHSIRTPASRQSRPESAPAPCMAMAYREIQTLVTHLTPRCHSRAGHVPPAA